MPILTLVTAVIIVLLWDLHLSRTDSILLLVLFVGLMGWTILQGIRKKPDALADEIETELKASTLSIRQAILSLSLGLVLLIVSSRILVWGAVRIAVQVGVSDMIIGLTIVAVGTSLPELASSVVAMRKGEDDIALGNVLGSNLLNTLAVVGVAGVIHPSSIPPETMSRDLLVMGVLTLSLFLIGFRFRGRFGRINRIEGAGLVFSYIAYTAWLILPLLGN